MELWKHSFYAIGIVYFLTATYNLFRHPAKKISAIAEKPNLDAENIIQQYRMITKSKITPSVFVRNIIDFVFFAWSFVGLVYFKDKNLFIIIICANLAYGLLLFIIGIMLAVNTVLQRKCEKCEQKNIYVPFSKMVYFLEAVSLATILIRHYCSGIF